MLLCLDRQTDQITVSGHYILVPPCLLWKTQEEGENGSWYYTTIVTGDDRRPTTEKIHAVSIYILLGSPLAFYFSKVGAFLVPNIKS